jgi:hypothetical protein
MSPRLTRYVICLFLLAAVASIVLVWSTASSDPRQLAPEITAIVALLAAIVLLIAGQTTERMAEKLGRMAEDLQRLRALAEHRLTAAQAPRARPPTTPTRRLLVVGCLLLVLLHARDTRKDSG